MKMYTYLNFNGNCSEAVNFYAKVFNVEPKLLHFKDMPANPNQPLDDSMKDLVLHGELVVGGNVLKFSDAMPHQPVTIGDNFNITISSDNAEQVTTWFNQMAEGGTILMPLGKTFFSEMYGYVRDQFGVAWQVMVEKEGQ